MARNSSKVVLGYEDECISDKYKSLVNHTTSKIGGKPDWPGDAVNNPLCQLCGLTMPLVLQVYAPLENSPYHRTLYLFGCINPNCWNHNDSWVCLRSQILDSTSDKDVSTSSNCMTTTDWCADADDWGDDNGNDNEENGNVINRIESCTDRNSDEDDDETESYEDDVRVRLGNLSVDERNANWGGGVGGCGGGGNRAAACVQEGGAVGRLHSPSASAEIEGDESGVVSIDTPTAPQRDLLALLQDVASVPTDLRVGASGTNSISLSPPKFSSFFISCGDEELENYSPTLHEHVLELLQEYQQNSDDGMHLPEHSDESVQGDHLTLENYEKNVPLHGDKMFHRFLLRIKNNPAQIIRYYRDGSSPLLLYPIQDLPSACRHCGSNLHCELQILPTLIPKLRLMGSGDGCSHLEFGTVLILTCKRSCWLPGETWRRETVIVQAERILD